MLDKKTNVKPPSSGEESSSKSTEVTRAEAVELNADLDKLNNPTLENGKAHMLASKQSWDKGISQEQAKMNTTLEDVHRGFEKWLYVDDPDRIDIALAVGVNYRTKGAPLWIVFVSPSGDWKSELLMSLTGLPNVILMDQITKNTLGSGLKDTIDLGAQLTGNRSLLIFPDLASLMSCNDKDKKMIWAQFRELYDGRINKRTGSGVVRKYDKCHVNLLAGATSVIENEYLLRQQIGTREMLADSDPKLSQNKNKMEMAWYNEDYEDEMRSELKKVVTDFCMFHKTKDIKITPEIKAFLFKQAEHLALLRATGKIDWNTSELMGSVEREVPTRLSKQFKRLWIALMSLDDNYSVSTAKGIIRKLVNSSGSKPRQKILEVFNRLNNRGNWLSVPDIQLETGLGRKIVKAECEQLTYLHEFEKRIYLMHIGGADVPNYEGRIAWSRGFDKEVDQYRITPQKKL